MRWRASMLGASSGCRRRPPHEQLALRGSPWHFAGGEGRAFRRGPMNQADFPLAGGFPPARREAGLELVWAGVKGVPYEKLAAKTYDGLTIEPLYVRKEDAQPVPGRAPGRPWQILQRVDHPDPAAANEQALHDLKNGATGLHVIFAGSNGANRYRGAPSEAAIARAF